jgi:biotin transporter BioY
MNSKTIRRGLVTALLALSLNAAQAQSEASALSALSGLPIAVSLTAPTLLLSTGGMLAVVAVEASAAGTVWVLERASDGARITLRLSAQAAGGLSVVAGTAVLVTAISAGWVLSAAGAAIAFIPNEIGAALLYNERITR